MIYCKPDISPRQMLWGICSQVAELESSLFECALYDSLLRDPHYSSAAQKLHDAQQSIAQLRSRASADLLSDLEKKYPDINSIVSQYH